MYMFLPILFDLVKCQGYAAVLDQILYMSVGEGNKNVICIELNWIEYE